jgi:peptidyl-prolyl cis-trans isomerase C
MTLSTSRFSLFAVVSILATAVLLSGCNKNAKSDGNSSPVIAEVNGEKLHRSQFDGYVNQESEFLDHDADGKVRSRLLDRLIKEKLIQQEATRLGLEMSGKSDPEKQKVAAKVASNATETATAATNSETGVLRDLVEKYQRQIVLKDVSVTTEEVEQYYQQNKFRFERKGGYYLSDIRVADRTQAETIYRQLTKLNGDFAQVAKEVSLSPTAAQGGFHYYEEGQLPSVFEDVVHKLNPGQISTIVTTEYGFHIFRLERKAEPLTTDDAKKQIKQDLIASKSQSLLDEDAKRLRASAKVKLYPGELNFSYTGEFNQK